MLNVFNYIKQYLLVILLGIILVYTGLSQYKLLIVEKENIQLKAELYEINRTMEIAKLHYEERLDEFNKTYNTPPIVVTKYKTIVVKEVVNGSQEDCNEVFRLIDSYSNIDGMLLQN